VGPVDFAGNETFPKRSGARRKLKESVRFCFLMFPFWDTQSGLTIPAGQVDAARTGATHLEKGKTTPLPLAAMLQNGLPPTITLCQAADGE
jgi:hypothetical protein